MPDELCGHWKTTRETPKDGSFIRIEQPGISFGPVISGACGGDRCVTIQGTQRTVLFGQCIVHR